jgi:hypothetical protein
LKFAHGYAVKFDPPMAEIRSKHSFEIRLIHNAEISDFGNSRPLGQFTPNLFGN